MAHPTVNVFVRVVNQAGQYVSGATVRAKLNRHEVYQGYVVPGMVELTTSATGEGTLALWPNELGATASQYEITILDPASHKTFRTTATIPNHDCNLWEVADVPTYPKKNVLEVAVDGALQILYAATGSLQSTVAAAQNAASAASASAAASNTSRAGAVTAADSAAASAQHAADSATTAGAEKTDAAASASAAGASATAAATSATEAALAVAGVPAVGTASSDVPTNAVADAKYAPITHTHAAPTAAQVGLGNVTNTAQVPLSAFTAVGDLIYGVGNAAVTRLARGADGQALVLSGGVPAWTTLSGGGWTAFDTAPTRTADATFTVADTAANQAIFVAGRPIRFRQNTSAAWFYAVVTAYSSGTVTLVGAPYTATIGADSGRQLQYGEMTRLQQETFQIAGRFAAVATTQAFKDYLLLNYAWLRGKAYCVGFRVLPLVDDSGAAQPRVNVKCNGVLVSTSNSGAGLAVSDAAWTATTTDIDPTGYALGYGQALELTIDTNGTNDDARDLTVIVSLVLE